MASAEPLDQRGVDGETLIGFSQATLEIECFGKVTTWLILPVVICLSQRLSHACLSISFYMAKLRMAH